MSLDRLQTEAHNPASANLDELTPLEIARLMNREDGRAVEAVGSQADAIAQAIEIIAEATASRGPARLRRRRQHRAGSACSTPRNARQPSTPRQDKSSASSPVVPRH